MALESGTYISDLVSTNPTHTDGVNQADSHLRLIKSALLATFPNVKGVVNASHSLLNSVATAFGTAGSLILSGNSNLTLTNSGGGLGVSGPVTAPSVNASGSMSVAGKDVGSFLVPSGAIMAWAGSAATIPAYWVICDGNNGTPDLRGRFVIGGGGAYGTWSTGGSASASTDVQGSHNHSGGTGQAGSFSVSTQTDSQGSHAHGGATQGYALGIADIPAHTHAQAQSAQASVQTSSGGTTMTVTTINGQSAVNGPYTAAAGNGNAHSHNIGADGAHTHSVSVSQGAHNHSISQDGAHSHTVSTLPPFYTLCYIMKV